MLWRMETAWTSQTDFKHTGFQWTVIQADLSERLIRQLKNKFFCIPESYSLYKYISLKLSWLWTFILKKVKKVENKFKPENSGKFLL